MILDTPTPSLQLNANGVRYIDNSITWGYKLIPYSLTSSNLATLTRIADRVYYTPFVLAQDYIVREIGDHINSTASVNRRIRLGIYAHNYQTGLPWSKLVETTDLWNNAGGYVSDTTLNYTLRAGVVYWGANLSDIGYAGRALNSASATGNFGFLTVGISTIGSIYQDLAPGSWTSLPASPSSLTIFSTIPTIFLGT